MTNRNSIIKEKYILTLIYGLSCVTWLIFNVYTGFSALYEGSVYHYILKPFLIGMTFLPIIGGIYGISKSKKWGAYKSAIGKSLLFLSLGLVAWGGGMVVWNYYLFFTELEVPYPSLADSIFILSWPFWSIGLFFLSKVIGAKFGLRTPGGKILVVLIPILAGLLSYYFLFKVARDGQIDFEGGLAKIFVDLFYPLGDVIILVITGVVYSLSRNFLGGIYRRPVQLLFIGFLLNYIADFIFAYITTTGSYYNGHFVDLLYITAMFILSISINSFDPKK